MGVKLILASAALLMLSAQSGMTQSRYNFSAAMPGKAAYKTDYSGKRLEAFDGPQKPGTIIVRTAERKLYLVLPGKQAMVYGVGVGRDGFTWKGTHRVTRKAEWPGWTPPAEMHKRQPGLPAYMPGGPDNPLGARAMYIGSTIYRIHGTSQPWTIGQAVSSGCIRMVNEEVIDLYSRVKVGATVIVQ
nr:L,D-transpeptidase [Rhodoligotrophos appendicifer]